MRAGWAALGLALAMAGAARADCGETLRLAVKPAEKTDDVAVVLRRRLEAAGVKAPAVERDGDGLKALLPAGVDAKLLTEPGKFEMRLVATSPDAAKLPRLDGGPDEAVEPQIILDEFRLRESKLVVDPNAADPRFALTLQFRLDPVGARNLMAASAEAIGRKLAVIVDDRVVVTPIIRAPIASGSGEVAGGFTSENTASLTEAMRGGRLPAVVSLIGRAPAVCKTN
jgi:preprotein translocase subunit SecD